MYSNEKNIRTLYINIMKPSLIILLVIGLCFKTAAQATQNTLVESGKLLVELVKIFKKNPLQQGVQMNGNNSSDLCFTNSTTDYLFIEVLKKINDSLYKVLPGSISLTPQAHECLLELPSSIYHYRVYKKNNGTQSLSLEGDLKLVPNEKMEREIK